MAIGMVLSYSPSKITANTAKKIAASEVSGRAVNFAASKGARAVEVAAGKEVVKSTQKAGPKYNTQLICSKDSTIYDLKPWNTLN